MKRIFAAIAFSAAAAALMAQAPPAKVPLNPAADKPLLAAVAKQAGANLQALVTYTYQQRVQVQVGGEDKGTTLVEIAFGPDGKPIVTPMSSTPPQGRQRHGLRGAIQKSMEEDAKKEIDGLVKLASSYTMLSPPKIQEMVQKAETLMIPAQNALRLDVKSFLVPGDEANFKFDAGSSRQTHTHVETSADGKPVIIDAQYQTLPTGLTTCAQTMINVPSKGIFVTVNTFDYQK